MRTTDLGPTLAAFQHTDQSDVELLVRVRAGDHQAEAQLLARHRPAVAELGESPCFSSVEASGRLALAMVRQGTDRDLPFRATWLGLHAQGTLPVRPPRDAVVWSAFSALPPAWRTAVWHREVEGQRPREIARLLGMSEEQAGRALASAYASLKRRVALAHPDAGAEGLCADLVDTYRFSPPSSLPAAEIRLLREHGRHCDPCLGLIRDLLLVEHTLRSTLAGVVLGAAADSYLVRRPRPARLRAPGPEVVRPERRLKPVLASFSAASIGAAAMALVLSTPAISPATQTPRDAYAATVPAPGRTLWPAGDSAAGAGVVPAAATTRRPADDLATAPDATDGTQPAEGRQGQDGPEAGQQPGTPAAPGTPGTPPVPPAPGTPTPPTPTPHPEPEPQPGPVDVDVEEGQATVSVDPVPGSSDPVVIEVPLPETDDVSLPDTGGLLP